MDALIAGTLALLLAGVLVTAAVGRWLAGRLKQPEIVLEITVCLLLGAVLVSQVGWGAPETAGREVLEFLGHFGLALFLVSAAHGIRQGGDRLSGRAVAWLSAGSTLPAMVSGVLLATWVLTVGSADLRGEASPTALTLMLAVSLAVTAVPVLAGILRDRRMENTEIGRLAMTSAVAIDAVTWVLLVVAIGLATGQDGAVKAVAVLLGGIPAVLAVRWIARTRALETLASRHPYVAMILVAVIAYAASQTTGGLGLTEIFGAVLVGFALPSDGAWARVSHQLGRLGRLLLPVMFTLTGTALAAGVPNVVSWEAIVIATGLAIVSKLAGSYAGARLGAQSRLASLKLAALMNTRGLTEIAVLQAGYSAGILAPGLFLALIVMALITTGLSGPLLWAVDRYADARTAKLESAA
ncbi:cation:proton antiporter [Micromonospora sp. LOL_021]|uniref:cation:proton antiporter n=1 Tax=Micromonospora sp. LOL_021 TaxID=3345417 RepID=UPI003A8697F9